MVSWTLIITRIIENNSPIRTAFTTIPQRNKIDILKHELNCLG